MSEQVNDLEEYVQSMYGVAFFKSKDGEISLLGEDGTKYFKTFDSIEEAKNHLINKRKHHSDFTIGKSDFSVSEGMVSTEWEEKDFLANTVKSEMSVQKDGEIIYDFLKPKENNALINHIKSKADYTHTDFSERTIYDIKGWSIIKNDLDPSTGKVIESEKLKLIHADHSENYNYLNGIKFNFRVFFDEADENYLALVHPHLGGDLRGNYDAPVVFEESSYKNLLERLQKDIIDFDTVCLIQFTDGSLVGFDANNIKTNFNFSISHFDDGENSISNRFVDHLNTLPQSSIDKVVHNCFNTYKRSIRFNTGAKSINYSDPEVLVSIEKSRVKDDSDNKKWFNIGICLDGDDAVSDILAWINEISGSGVDYTVEGHRGFGERYISKKMAESDFDALINAYKEYKVSKYPLSVIETYMKENSISTHEDAIRDMKLSFVGSFNNIGELGKKWVREGKIKPNFEEIKIINTKSVADADSDIFIKKADFKKMLRYTGMDSQYNSNYKKVKDQIEILEERKSIFEDELKVTSGIEYDVILDMLSEIEMDIEQKKQELHSLPHKMSQDVSESAKKKRFDEVDNLIKNDLDSFLAEYGYDDMTQLDFIELNYMSIGNRIMDNHYAIQTKGSDNSKLYVFYVKEENQKRKNIEIGKPNEYPIYLMEMTTKKLVSGHDSKNSAEEKRKELIEKYKNLRFSVYPKSTIQGKYKLDTKDYSSFIKLDNLKYSNVVSCKRVSGRVIKPKTPIWFFKKSMKEGHERLNKEFSDLIDPNDQVILAQENFIKIQSGEDEIYYLDVENPTEKMKVLPDNF